MLLSDLAEFIDEISMLSDGEFQGLGLIATRGEGPMLSFIENDKYLEELKANDSASCIITKPELGDRIKSMGRGVLLSDSPRLLFFSIHHALLDKTDFYGRKEQNNIAKSAMIHASACIAGNGVSIGERVEIGPHTVIGERVSIGDDVQIGANSVIGGDGFECFKVGDTILNIRHAGSVIIGRGVSMHSGICIDRGLFGNATVIGEHCSIDNLVHIAHNVQIGPRTRIAAMAMIAGRACLGEDGWVGPNVLVSNGISIGKRCNLVMGTIVTKSVEDDRTVQWRIAY